MFNAWVHGALSPPLIATMKYVAAGVAGTLLTSSDGSTWTARTSGFGTNGINAVAYGNGKYVAVGATGKISTSENAVDWSMTQVGAQSIEFMAVEFFAGVFYVISNGTTMYTSVDAVTWTARTQPSGSTTWQGSGSNSKVALFGGSTLQRGSIVVPALPGTPTTVEMGFGGSYYGQWAAYYANDTWFGGGQAFKISTAAANATTGLPGGWTIRKGQDVNTNSCVRDFVYDPYRLKYVAVGGNSPYGTTGPALISTSANGTSWPTATSLSTALGSTNYILSAAVSAEAGYVGTANGVWKTTDYVSFTKVATSGIINHLYIRPDL